MHNIVGQQYQLREGACNANLYRSGSIVAAQAVRNEPVVACVGFCRVDFSEYQPAACLSAVAQPRHAIVIRSRSDNLQRRTLANRQLHGGSERRRYDAECTNIYGIAQHAAPVIYRNDVEPLIGGSNRGDGEAPEVDARLQGVLHAVFNPGAGGVARAERQGEATADAALQRIDPAGKRSGKVSRSVIHVNAGKGRRIVAIPAVRHHAVGSAIGKQGGGAAHQKRIAGVSAAVVEPRHAVVAGGLGGQVKRTVQADDHVVGAFGNNGSLKRHNGHLVIYRAAAVGGFHPVRPAVGRRKAVDGKHGVGGAAHRRTIPVPLVQQRPLRNKLEGQRRADAHGNDRIGQSGYNGGRFCADVHVHRRRRVVAARAVGHYYVAARIGAARHQLSVVFGERYSAAVVVPRHAAGV